MALPLNVILLAFCCFVVDFLSSSEMLLFLQLPFQPQGYPRYVIGTMDKDNPGTSWLSQLQADYGVNSSMEVAQVGALVMTCVITVTST